MSISNVSGSSGNNYSVSGSNRQFGSVSEYTKDLKNKYPSLTPSKSASVTISNSLLRKAMTNEKTGQWLEENLKAIPDIIEKTRNDVKSDGSRLNFVSLEITGEDEMTMLTIETTDAASPNNDLEKWLEKIRDKNREMTKEDSNKVDELMKNIKVVSAGEDRKQANVSFSLDRRAEGSGNGIDYFA